MPDRPTDLYDVELALRELATHRVRRDGVTAQCITIADKLAHSMSAHFGPEAIETAGLALVIAAASILALEDVPTSVLSNILALTGQRLVLDARAADEAVMF